MAKIVDLVNNPRWDILRIKEYVKCFDCGKEITGTEEFYALMGWMPIVMLNKYYCKECYPDHKLECFCSECNEKWQTRARQIVSNSHWSEEEKKEARKTLKKHNINPKK